MKYYFKRLYNLYLRKFLNFYYISRNASIRPFCDIKPRYAPYISIGKDAKLHEGIWLNIHPSTTMKAPIIKIETGCIIGRRTTISGKKKIVIGKNALIAPNVFITDHLHGYSDKNTPIKLQEVQEAGSVTIEEGCWLGHGCAIVASEGNDIIIGRNSVIGANSVVTKSCPEYSTLIGIPARNVARAMRRV